jgi:Phage major tail protein 2.
MYGNYILLKVNSVTYAGQLDSSLNVNCGLSNVVKDGGKYAEFLPERLEGEVSGTFIYDRTVHSVFWNYFINRTKIEIRFGETTTGGLYVKGYGYITGMPLSAPHNGISTISITVKLSGEFSLQTV